MLSLLTLLKLQIKHKINDFSRLQKHMQAPHSLPFTVNVLSLVRVWCNIQADWMTITFCTVVPSILFYFRRFYSGHLTCLFSSPAVCSCYCLCNHLYNVWQIFLWDLQFFIILYPHTHLLFNPHSLWSCSLQLLFFFSLHKLWSFEECLNEQRSHVADRMLHLSICLLSHVYSHSSCNKGFADWCH